MKEWLPSRVHKLNKTCEWTTSEEELKTWKKIPTTLVPAGTDTSKATKYMSPKFKSYRVKINRAKTSYRPRPWKDSQWDTMKMINCTDTRRRWDEHTVLEEKEANVCLESFPGISPMWGLCTERSRPRKNIRLIIRMETTTTCWSISLYAVEGIESAEKTVGSIFSCCWKTPTESQPLF